MKSILVKLTIFYKFRERLINQAEKYGTNVEIVLEYLTIKTCSKCKKRNEAVAKKYINVHIVD